MRVQVNGAEVKQYLDRNLIMALIGSAQPWEVAVGQAIARLKSEVAEAGENSLTDFLGPKIVDALDLRPTEAVRRVSDRARRRAAAA